MLGSQGRRFRTADVLQEGDFSQFLLSSTLLTNLISLGFEKPSPVQREGIPIALRSENAMFQAKSGTGKTLVFAIAIVERFLRSQDKSNLGINIVIAPTREISAQSCQIIQALGQNAGISCELFIGGLSLKQDLAKIGDSKSPDVMVGTPGRLIQMLELIQEKKNFASRGIRMLVLDEVDQMMKMDEELARIFTLVKEINCKRKSLSCQVFTFSATYTDFDKECVLKFMKIVSPQSCSLVMIDEERPTLVGVTQLYDLVEETAGFQTKVEHLLKILSRTPFHQCIVFSNFKARAEEVVQVLNECGWPSIYIAGGQEQRLRLHALSHLKKFQVRILVSTDLTSRGIDASKVTLVINLDLPKDKQTYLHRIGRTGRFGTLGTAISIVEKSELGRLRDYANQGGLQSPLKHYRKIEGNHENFTELTDDHLNEEEKQSLQYFQEKQSVRGNLDSESISHVVQSNISPDEQPSLNKQSSYENTKHSSRSHRLPSDNIPLCNFTPLGRLPPAFPFSFLQTPASLWMFPE